jgi:alpha-ketoglutaric semialdehyde dehydrogenase
MTVRVRQLIAGRWRDGSGRRPRTSGAEVLGAAARLLDAQAEQYGAELTREEGKTLAEGVGEGHRAAQILCFNAGEAHREAGELYSSSRRGEPILVVRRPLGVVALITPSKPVQAELGGRNATAGGP